MVPFSLDLPRAIVFGAGSLQAAAERARAVGRRVCVISGPRWLAASGLMGRLGGMLGGCVVENVPCREGEPTTDSIAEARDRVRELNADVILAVGGGSVLDTAKALSALVRLDGRVDEYLEGVEGTRPIEREGIPWIAVPTTAGTGAEATRNAVVKSTTLGVKRSIRSARLMAAAVVVDPELTRSLPRGVTGTSGLDALTQLVEAFVSRRSTPPVRALVSHAFPLMVDALRRLAADLTDMEARSDAAYGALVSGVALANAGLGAAHGFAAGLGGAYDIPHGLICAVMIPRVLAANAPVIRDAVAGLVGARAGGADPVEWLAHEVEDLLRAFSLPRDLRAYGIPRARVPELCRLSMGTSMKANPRDLSTQELETLLMDVI